MASEAELTPSWEKARWRFSPAPQVLQRGLRESGPPRGETAGAPGKAPSGQPAAQGAGDGGRRGQQPRPPPARQCPPPPRPARPRARQLPCRGGRLVPNPLARAGGSAGGAHWCPPGGESALTWEWESRTSLSPRRTPFSPEMRRHRCLTHPKAASTGCWQLSVRDRAVPAACAPQLPSSGPWYVFPLGRLRSVCCVQL